VEFGGTLDYTTWLAAPAGVHLLRTLGLDRVRQHNIELVEYGQRVVGEALGLDPAQLPNRTGPVSMRLVPVPPGWLPDRTAARELQQRLATEFGCQVPVSAWADRFGIRVCAQVYNRREDYHRLADALARVLRRPGARAA
jgi:isopenicillin-N epimerase